MPRFCIVDIETTNVKLQGNKVTEIALFVWENGQCIDHYESLVQPGIPIPHFIEGLTGISDEMVQDAPAFAEIATEITQRLEGAVFVAHSVQFDYNVLKSEFQALGQDFVYPKLCTVRLSRSLVPGLRSYSLGKLCSSLGIPLNNRHRAGGDAKATVKLLEYLIALPEGAATLERFLNRRSREASLPPGIKAQEIQALPEQAGVYYFHNAQNEIIYIGKAINIRQRVWSHFYGKSTKAQNIRKEIASVHYQLAGSELMALLMESTAIQTHWPRFNRAQKRKPQTYGIFSYEDRQGLKHLAFDLEKRSPQQIIRMPSAKHCQEILSELCKHSAACPKFFHLLGGAQNCSAHPLSQCQGDCTALTDPNAHNEKIAQSIAQLGSKKENQLLLLPGRSSEEQGFLVLEGGQYRGYGFAPIDLGFSHFEELEPFMTPCPNTPETQGILLSYLLRPVNDSIIVGKPLKING